MKQKFILTLTTFVAFALMLTTHIHAQTTTNVDLDETFDIDEKIELETITIPFFPQIALPGSEYDTIWSWISFFGALFSIGMVIFWIYLILKAGLNVYQKQGQPEGIQESLARLKAVLTGAAFTMLVPVIFVIIGSIVGLGAPWRWPAAFRDCPNSPYTDGTKSNVNIEGSRKYDFYFQAVLDAPVNEDPQSWANKTCFGSGESPNT